MDEAIDDEVVEPVDVQNEEFEFSLKLGSSNILKSNEPVTTGIHDYPGSSKHMYSDILNAKNLDRIDSSEHANASPHCMDDAGVMVEELTLRKYDGENLTIVGMSARDSGTKVNCLHGQTASKNNDHATSGAWEDGNNRFFSMFLDPNRQLQNLDHHAAMDNLGSNENNVGSNDDNIASSIMNPPGGMRTKILSKSGFSEYFMKSALGEKGVMHETPICKGPVTKSLSQDCGKSGAAAISDAPLSSISLAVSPFAHGVSKTLAGFDSSSLGDGTSLREWIDAGQDRENKVESLRIFKQVLDIMNFSHSRGFSLQEFRPSCFKLLESNKIIYHGSYAHAKAAENIIDQQVCEPSHGNEKRPIRQHMLPWDKYTGKKPKVSGSLKFTQRWPQFPSRSSNILALKNVSDLNGVDHLDRGNDKEDEHNPKGEGKKMVNIFSNNAYKTSQTLQASASFLLEEKWYKSPEPLNEMSCTAASNVYGLGILLFELLGSFDSGRSHVAAMLDLQQRILPPRFLSENPREAGFILWLLHPEPSLRPTTRAILQSELITGIQESSGVEFLSSIEEEDEESDLMLHFLSSLNEQKHKDVSNLVEQINCIEADIQEVVKRHPRKSLVLSSSGQEAPAGSGRGYCHEGNPSLDVSWKTLSLIDKDTRLMSNFRKLEKAYFSVRHKIQISETAATVHKNAELLKSRENWSSTLKEKNTYNTEDCLGDFFDGLCKYARYEKFHVQGVLRNGEFSNFASVICSLSFDRDEDYLAAGLVSKKIKIFDFHALLTDPADIHYPVAEMANRSKLSCICWNSYIRNYIASADYEGIVKIWDAGTGKSFCHFVDHGQRAWSVDFSRLDPMKLASGSDDCLVKLWNINEKNSLCTIRNNANVCSVQFSAYSAHLLAFSSADYKTYCFDLRNPSTPWCILAGHEKAVSYAKFLDSGTLVSASTDNTLKIWDLNKTTPNRLSRDACVLTLRGHTNERNFVGLSVLDGYIACGSETNEVFVYYKSLPIPITSHKFGSVDSVTGKETEDANEQFVSSVCWRRKSNTVVAANSSGCVKLLQLV